MARVQFFLLALAACVIAIHAAPSLNAPSSHTAELSHERNTASRHDSSSLRGLVQEFAKGRHGRHGPRYHTVDGLPMTSVWSSPFWMSLATRSSVDCSFRKSGSHHHRHHPEASHHHKTFDETHAKDRFYAASETSTIANDAKGAFVLLLLASTAICSLYLTWKVLSVTLEQ